MLGFKIVHADFQIRFRLYSDEAPITVNSFISELPFIREFMHARISGQEISIHTGLKAKPRITSRPPIVSVIAERKPHATGEKWIPM